MIREVQFYNNESDSEPEAGETKQTIKRQIKVKKVAKNDIQFFKMTAVGDLTVKMVSAIHTVLIANYLIQRNQAIKDSEEK